MYFQTMRQVFKNRNGKFRDPLDNPILQPCDWQEDEDGELQPMFFPPPPLPCPPFRFLELPLELRFEIYRHCLILPTPICGSFHARYPDQNDHDLYKNLPIHLLRTCRQIHREAGRILYGENEFRFCGLHEHLLVPRFLRYIGLRNSLWIKKLTMSTPFMGIRPIIGYGKWGATLYAGRAESGFDENNYELAGEFGPYEGPSTWVQLAENVLHEIEIRTSVAQLTLVISPGWWNETPNILYNEDAEWGVADTGRIEGENETVWKLLGDFLRTKPYLSVNIVRVCQDEDNFEYNILSQVRHIKNMRERLGVWAYRLVESPQVEPWIMPKHSDGEDPEDYLEYLRLLFEDRSWYCVERTRLLR